MEAGNIQNHLICSDTFLRAVNMLNLLYGQCLFMFVQLHPPDPSSHIIRLHPAVARWCCWEWCRCFQHHDLAPAFVVLSDVLPSREGDYMGSGTTPTFSLCYLHLEEYLKVWVSFWIWDRNLSEHSYSFLLTNWTCHAAFFDLIVILVPQKFPKKTQYGEEKNKIYALELCFKVEDY